MLLVILVLIEDSVELLVLSPQREAQARRDDTDQETEGHGDVRALGVVGLLVGGEDVGAEEGAALAEGLEDGPAAGALALGAVHVGDPRHHERDGDEDEDGEVDADVARGGVVLDGEQDEADGGDEPEEADEGPPHAQLVGGEVDGEDDEEAEDVRGRREAVGLDGGEDADLGDDAGHEEWEAGKGYLSRRRKQGGCGFVSDWKVSRRALTLQPK